MSTPKKHIVFDVVGTLVSYDAFYTRLTDILGPTLLPQSAFRPSHLYTCHFQTALLTDSQSQDITPQSFAFTWQTSAELEFTFLSISGSYTPYLTVLRGLFYRTLMQLGIPEPRALISEHVRELCVEAYGTLEMRHEVNEAFEVLRNEGFEVWVFTTGDVGRVKGYFERGGVDMPVRNIISCDGLGVAKPDLRAYRHVYEKFAEEDVKWFAAAHMWDVTAATKVGFRGAWTDVLEGEAAGDVFGEDGLEVVAKGLMEMVRGVVERSK